jgi:hypothetical protein
MKRQWIMCLLLAGCATPYQAAGFRGGYTDYPAGRGVYFVGFSGNGYTGKAAVTEMWHRRAAELCGGQDRYEVVSRDGETDQSFYVANGQLNTVNKTDVEGYIRCVDAQGKVVTARPATAPSSPPPKEPSALVQPEGPAREADTSQRQPECEMRGGRRYCH